MANSRRLPPVLRVASLLRLLFPVGLVAVFAYLVTAGAWSSAHVAVYASRAAVIAVNLSLLGWGCSLVVGAYTARSARLTAQQPGNGPFSLQTWQSQARAILALTTVPGCALLMAVIVPPTVGAFQLVFPTSILGAIVFLVVALSVGFVREAYD